MERLGETIAEVLTWAPKLIELVEKIAQMAPNNKALQTIKKGLQAIFGDTEEALNQLQEEEQATQRAQTNPANPAAIPGDNANPVNAPPNSSPPAHDTPSAAGPQNAPPSNAPPSSTLDHGVPDSTGPQTAPPAKQPPTTDPAAPKPAYKPCFLAGTLVDSGDGLVPIERIAVGAWVLGRGPGVGALAGRYQVTAIHHGSTAAVIQVGVGGAVIQSTRDHRFQVPGQGWVAARDLQPGDLLAQPDGTRVALQAAELLRLPVATPTYNLTVAEVSTYFVHVAGYSVWVHNESPPLEGFDRTLYWLFKNLPNVRETDRDGMSLWRTNSWEDVQKFMQVRVGEGQISTSHAAYTVDQIEQLSNIGLRTFASDAQLQPHSCLA